MRLRVVLVNARSSRPQYAETARTSPRAPCMRRSSAMASGTGPRWAAYRVDSATPSESAAHVGRVQGGLGDAFVDAGEPDDLRVAGRALPH